LAEDFMSDLLSSAETPRSVVNGTLARHRVRDGIQQLILSGAYRPGQRLLQQELATHFKVAQGVVREALLELQFCGLVQAIDNLGMFVSGLGARVILDAYEIREVLEGLAARLCCENASRADLRELRELAGQVRQNAQKGNLIAMGMADRRFHYRMVVASQNQVLGKLTDGYRVLGMFVRANREPRKVQNEHETIIQAIEANQPDMAESLARRHVAASRQAIAQQVAQGAFVPCYVSDPENPRPPAGVAAPRPSPSSRKRRRKTASS
jgi:DNA-binding GntR family transcriptional regulator